MGSSNSSMCAESDAPRAAIRAGTISYLYTSASSAGTREERGKQRRVSNTETDFPPPGVAEAQAGAYIVSVFGEGLGAGHHGCGSLLQLSQFLPSLVQGYPSAGQFSHHARRRSLHALHAARAGDVLGQAPGGLAGSRFANCKKTGSRCQSGKEKVSWRSVGIRRSRRREPCCTHRGPPCPETELLHQTGL